MYDWKPVNYRYMIGNQLTDTLALDPRQFGPDTLHHQCWSIWRHFGIGGTDVWTLWHQDILALRHFGPKAETVRTIGLDTSVLGLDISALGPNCLATAMHLTTYWRLLTEDDTKSCNFVFDGMNTLVTAVFRYSTWTGSCNLPNLSVSDSILPDKISMDKTESSCTSVLDLFIHWTSDYETYGVFFDYLKRKLRQCSSQPVLYQMTSRPCGKPWRTPSRTWKFWLQL